MFKKKDTGRVLNSNLLELNSENLRDDAEKELWVAAQQLRNDTQKKNRVNVVEYIY